MTTQANHDPLGNRVDEVLVSEGTRADAKGYGPLKDAQDELAAVTERRLAIQAELQPVGNAAMIRENREYVLADRGPRAWFLRKREMEESQARLVPQLKAIEQKQRALISRVRHLRGIRSRPITPKASRQTIVESLDVLRARVNALEERIARLESSHSRGAPIDLAPEPEPTP